MNTNIVVKKTYKLEMDDDEMRLLWEAFDLARDTIQRLPVNKADLVGFMTDVESSTCRYERIRY